MIIYGFGLKQMTNRKKESTKSTYPANIQSAADAICVRLLGTKSTLVTMDLWQCGQDVPVGPGPNLAGADPVVEGDTITVVRGGAAGATTRPGGGGGLSPKYDGGGAGLRADCSYGGGSPILFSTEIIENYK